MLKTYIQVSVLVNALNHIFFVKGYLVYLEPDSHVRPLTLGARPPALIKFSTSSVSSYLKSSHYDHVHIIFNGLRVT